MRTTWNGSLSFGLVTIPVGLAPATKPAARQSDVSFRMLHRECMTPIKQKRWCPVHDREVAAEEIVKGWEVAKGEFVVVEEGELEAIERDSTSRAIDITRFVPEVDVDPIFFDRTYFLVPAGQAPQRRPYALLIAAMRETGTAALGRFVLAGKEKLCLIRVKGDGLVLETLYLAEDVYSQAEIDEAVASVAVKEPELQLARQIVEGLAGAWEPSEQLVSGYREDLRKLLQAKLTGQEIARPVEPVAEAPVVDLLEALRRSVEEAKQRAGGADSAKPRPKASARRRQAEPEAEPEPVSAKPARRRSKAS